MVAIHSFTALLDSIAGLALVTWLARLTLLTAIACAYVMLARRAQPALRHAVAVGSLIAVVLLPLASKLLPAVSVPVLRAPEVTVYRPAPSASPIVAEPKPSSFEVSLPEAVTSPTVGAIDVPSPEPVSVAPATTSFSARALRFASDAVRSSTNWIRFAVVLWGIVALALLVRLGIIIARAGAIARRAEPVSDEVLSVHIERACRVLRVRRRPEVSLSREIKIPIVVGAMRPRIVLPVAALGWSHQRVGIVMLHELAHIRRRDCAWMLFAQVVRSVLWFHPLVVMLSRTVRAESERACDALVLATGVRGSDYAGHLVSIAAMSAGRAPFASATLAFASRSTLEQRVESILSANHRVTTRRLIGSVLLASLVMFVVIAAAYPARKPAKHNVITYRSDALLNREIRNSIRDAMRAATEVTNLETQRAVLDAQRAAAKTSFKFNYDEKAAYRYQLAGNDDDDEDEGEEWYDRAHNYYQRERWDKAGRAYESAARFGHNRATAYYNSGCSYALAGQTGKAIEMLELAFDEGFDDLDMYAADEDLNSLRDDPRFKKLMDSVRNTDEADQERRQAGREYDRLAKRTNVEEGDWNSVGIELLRAGDYDRAAVAFDNEFKISKNTDENALYNKACARALDGKSDEAIKLLEQSIITGSVSAEHMDKDPDLLSLHKIKRFDELVGLAEDLELDYSGSVMNNDWGWVEKKVKHVADSEKEWAKRVPHYQDVAKQHPTIGRAWSNLAFAQLKAGDAKASTPSFQKALDLGYKSSTTMYNLACSNAQAGSIDAAFTWLDKAEKAGFEVWQYARWDEDLDPMRADPRWKAKKQAWKDAEREHEDKDHDEVRVQMD